MELALIAAGVMLYLYLEIWTIRICLRYGGWAVAGVLAVDHILLFASPWFAPGYLGWKVWFLWTAVRAEPVRGILWTPKLRPAEYTTPFRWPGWRAWLLYGFVPLAVFALTLALIPEIAGLPFLLALVIWVVSLSVLLFRWCANFYSNWRVRRQAFREPAPWTAGPYTW
jgi:hypothetical protein